MNKNISVQHIGIAFGSEEDDQPLVLPWSQQMGGSEKYKTPMSLHDALTKKIQEKSFAMPPTEAKKQKRKKTVKFGGPPDSVNRMSRIQKLKEMSSKPQQPLIQVQKTEPKPLPLCRQPSPRKRSESIHSQQRERHSLIIKPKRRPETDL